MRTKIAQCVLDDLGQTATPVVSVVDGVILDHVRARTAGPAGLVPPHVSRPRPRHRRIA